MAIMIEPEEARLFWALGNPVRLQILRLLIQCGGQRSMSQLVSCCDKEPHTIKSHLSILEESGLVLVAGKDGNALFYAAVPARVLIAQHLLGEMLAGKE